MERKNRFFELINKAHSEETFKKFSSKNYNLVILDSAYLNNKYDLFKVFSDKLKFPGYFGNNWDAFWDCITDLEWLNVKDTVIIIKNFQILRKKEFYKTFIETIKDTIDYWKKEKVDFKVLILKES